MEIGHLGDADVFTSGRAEHFQQSAEFPPLRNSGLPMPRQRSQRAGRCILIRPDPRSVEAASAAFRTGSHSFIDTLLQTNKIKSTALCCPTRWASRLLTSCDVHNGVPHRNSGSIWPRPLEKACKRKGCGAAGRFDRGHCGSNGPQCASGSGRSWNFTSFGGVPLPPSTWNGVRLPADAQMPRPFQPPFGSSIRPSMVLA
jgi:hypothetical protein